MPISDRETNPLRGASYFTTACSTIDGPFVFIDGDRTVGIPFLSSPHAPWLPPDLVRGRSVDGPRGDLVMLADWSVGEAIKSLDRMGAAENTLLIFTSDNGPHPGTPGHRSEGRRAPPFRGGSPHSSPSF